MNAYFQFTTAKRKEIQDETGLKGKELNTKFSELWKGMSDADKVEWNTKKEEDKLRYEKAMETYQAPEGYSKEGYNLTVEPTKIKVVKKLKDSVGKKKKSKKKKVWNGYYILVYVYTYT